MSVPAKRNIQYRRIPVGRGLFTKVAIEDFDDLCQFNWRIISLKNPYVHGRRKGGGRESIYMARYILGAIPGQFVDHIDRDKLNNQRCNLRFCTRSENQWNRAKVSGQRASKYKGVEAKRDRWASAIRVHGTKIHLGVFRTQKAAALAYNAAVTQHHGKFAVLNKVKTK